MNYIEKQDLIAARKSRNQMHRRAQLAEAKLKATYKLLEREGAYHLEAPVVVQKDGDIVRLLSTINAEKYWQGIELGKTMSPSIRSSIIGAVVGTIRSFAFWLNGLKK